MTETSEFGVGKREGHDASKFYNRRLYEDLKLPKPSKEDLKENAVPNEYLDRIVVGDAREVLKNLPDKCIHLMVTSPPYNVGKEYDENLSLGEYLDFIEDVMREVYRVLVWGGRVCFNVADLGRKPYIPLHAYLIDRFEKIGYLMRGIIVWYKGDAVAGNSCAWGSFKSATNPVLRDVHEYILVLSKGSLKREKGNKQDDITKEEFLEWTKSVWKIQPESAKKIGHPAPFPVELPYRCIKLYTFRGDVVLDPFMGSGTTAIACLMTGRHFVGIEINPKYVELAKKRIKEFIAQKRLSGFSTQAPLLRNTT